MLLTYIYNSGLNMEDLEGIRNEQLVVLSASKNDRV